MNQRLNLSPGPHVRDVWTTSFIMKMVLLALMPATVIGICTFGLKALWVVLVSVVSAVGAEFIFDKLTGKPDTWKDGSAAAFRTDDTELVLELNKEPGMKGSLKTACSVSDALVLQYYEADDEHAAFGKTLTQIHTFSP